MFNAPATTGIYPLSLPDALPISSLPPFPPPPLSLSFPPPPLSRHVSGLNAGQARNIVEWRERSGPFQNREQLRLVKGVGPKSYQQCAGFIRINPHNLHTHRYTHTHSQM